MKNTLRSALAMCCILVCGSVSAQFSWQPSTRISSVFDRDDVATLCVDGRVDVVIALGLISNMYNINVVELGRRNASVDLPVDAGIQQTLVGWLAGLPPEAPSGMRQDTFDNLSEARTELIDFLREGESRSPVSTDGFSIHIDGDSLDSQILRDVFGAVPQRAAQTQSHSYISCPDLVTTESSRRPQNSRLTVAVRATIEDLQLRRSLDSAAFKKAKAASISYTDNNIKGESSLTADFFVGVGTAESSQQSIYGFLGLDRNETETRDPDDDDDSKDIRAVSLGVLWGRPVISNRRSNQRANWAGTFGLSAFQTRDQEQDSRFYRVRAHLNDIAFSLGRGTNYCGNTIPLLNQRLLFDCRINLYAEVADVADAGTSSDFETLIDDDYAAVGGKLAFMFGFNGLDALRPLAFRLGYDRLHVVGGDLPNQNRREYLVAYKIGESNFSLEMSYTDGPNLMTFEKEKLRKLAIAWKY